jgi:hypothetical protein
MPGAASILTHDRNKEIFVLKNLILIFLVTVFTPPSFGDTFRGYDCTQNCEGHEAGYSWAEQQGIDDPDDCEGNSESFIEGCRAYAEEQQGSSEEEDDEESEE